MELIPTLLLQREGLIKYYDLMLRFCPPVAGRSENSHNTLFDSKSLSPPLAD
jgi:hypothetical protein